jgi:hypothetical protein
MESLPAYQPTVVSRSKPTPSYSNALLYTLRRAFSPSYARTGSWASFYFPQYLFTYKNKKIDLRLLNLKTVLHAIFTSRACFDCLFKLILNIVFILKEDIYYRRYRYLNLKVVISYLISLSYKLYTE